MTRRIGIAAAAIMLVSAVSFRADERWIESKRDHYTVFYQAGFEKDAEFTRTWLDRAEQLMKTKYGVTPERYRMSI
ncbi:MAG: hypothetical protein ACXW3C_01305, partial [Pyrinomonadaceae bacterium]